MESRSEPATEPPFLVYDAAAARLLLVVGGERHEIALRAQGHRIVRYMVDRNTAGGAPVLCLHDDLMRAVWGDEPMHTREELAKLVWELRKRLEPYGAASLIENQRGLGYRLHARAQQDAMPAPRATARRRVWPWVAGAAIAIAIAAAAAIALARGSGDSPSNPTIDVAAERTFVDRVENVLDQAAAGRREVQAALQAGLTCAIAPQAAASRISSVADNRQSVLGQLAAMAAPDQQAADAVTLLQRALQDSIEADRHFRDVFRAVRSRRCPVPRNQDFRLGTASNARATAAKRRFVRVFNPLAAKVGRPAWSATAF
jgi:DNA-binding winged helix-turn-helix (wHTH) protein